MTRPLQLIMVAAFAATPALADPPRGQDISASSTTRQETAQHAWPEAARENVSGYFIRAVDGIDRFFVDNFSRSEARRNKTFDQFYGDRRVEDDAKKSRLRISPRIQARDADGVSPDVQFGVNLALPITSDRLQLVINNINDDTDVLDNLNRQQSQSDDSQQNNDKTAALRLLLKETLHFRATIDGGVKFKPLPIPRARLRLRMWQQMGPVVVRPGQSFFWE
ncbi:MAG TPA: hypothetical protein VIH35_07715, partial [Kiritimatiellia bacterium]